MNVTEIVQEAVKRAPYPKYTSAAAARAIIAHLSASGYVIVKREAGTLREAAERLIVVGSKIERASSEDEENHLCDERDKLLAQFRIADAALPDKEGL